MILRVCSTLTPPALLAPHLLRDRLRRRVATSSRTSPYPSTSTKLERRSCPSAASGVASRLRVRDMAPRGELAAEPERDRASGACPLAAPGLGRGPGPASRAHGALDALTRPGGRCTRGWPLIYLAAQRSSHGRIGWQAMLNSPQAMLHTFMGMHQLSTRARVQ